MSQNRRHRSKSVGRHESSRLGELGSNCEDKEAAEDKTFLAMTIPCAGRQPRGPRTRKNVETNLAAIAFPSFLAWDASFRAGQARSGCAGEAGHYRPDARGGSRRSGIVAEGCAKPCCQPHQRARPEQQQLQYWAI